VGQTELQFLERSFSILLPPVHYGPAIAICGRSSFNRACLTLLALICVSDACAQIPDNLLEAQVRSSYESNFFRNNSQSQPTLPARTGDEFTLTPSLKLNAVIPVSLQSIEFMARAAYIFHANNERFDAPDYGAQAKLNWALSDRCKGKLAAGFQIAPGKLEDTLATSPTEISDQDYVFGGECNVIPDWSLGVAARRNVQRSNAAIFAANAIDENSLTGRLIWRRSDRLSIAAVVDYRDIEQPKLPPTRIVLTGNSLSVWEIGSDIRFEVTPKVILSLSPGYSFVEDPTGRQSRSGVTGMAELSWNYSPKLSFELRGGRDITNSSAIGAIGYRLGTLGARMTWVIDPRWTTSLDIGQQTLDVQRVLRLNNGPETLQPLRDKTFLLRSDLRYSLSDRIAAAFAARYQQRNSNLDRFDFNNKSFSFQLEYLWP
jgi:Putative beta-barrel porin 2